jgi:hypothetical protein
VSLALGAPIVEMASHSATVRPRLMSGCLPDM